MYHWDEGFKGELFVSQDNKVLNVSGFASSSVAFRTKVLLQVQTSVRCGVFLLTKHHQYGRVFMVLAFHSPSVNKLWGRHRTVTMLSLISID